MKMRKGLPRAAVAKINLSFFKNDGGVFLSITVSKIFESLLKVSDEF